MRIPPKLKRAKPIGTHKIKQLSTLCAVCRKPIIFTKHYFEVVMFSYPRHNECREEYWVVDLDMQLHEVLGGMKQ